MKLKKEEEAFVVYFSTGEYSDFRLTTVFITPFEEIAKQFCNEANNILKEHNLHTENFNNINNNVNDMKTLKELLPSFMEWDIDYTGAKYSYEKLELVFDIETFKNNCSLKNR